MKVEKDPMSPKTYTRISIAGVEFALHNNDARMLSTMIKDSLDNNTEGEKYENI
jgi:hypothetical protein